MIFPLTKMYFCIHFSPWLWASAFVLIYSGWTAKIVLCWCCGKDGASPGNVPWERCGGEGKALWGAPALGQWGGEGASKTDETGTVGGPCPHTHTHKKRLYWAGYRETRICQPRLLARMKHSELSWLIIEFNPTLRGIKYIQSPPCYWHIGNSWRKCVRSCQRAENWEQHKHFCTLLPVTQGLKAVLILTQIFASPKHVACRHKVTDLLGSPAGCTAPSWSCCSRKAPRAAGAEVHTQLMPTMIWTL